VGGDKVADEGQDGHDNVLGDGDDIGAGHFDDCNATIGFIGCVEVDVVRTDTGGDGDLELLCFGEAFGGQIAGVEAAEWIG